MSASILETFPDTPPAATIQIGTDTRLHFVDTFGSRWCEEEIETELTGEIIEDDPIDALCDECKRLAEYEATS